MKIQSAHVNSPINFDEIKSDESAQITGFINEVSLARLQWQNLNCKLSKIKIRSFSIATYGKSDELAWPIKIRDVLPFEESFKSLFEISSTISPFVSIPNKPFFIRITPLSLSPIIEFTFEDQPEHPNGKGGRESIGIFGEEPCLGGLAALLGQDLLFENL